MSMKAESDRSDYGFKVEGDLGDLQIVEESSEDDYSDDVGSENPKVNERESRTVREDDSSKVGTVANIPHGLVQASTTPIFGTVQVTHSDNAQFGNNTYFNGPVTIKHVIQTTSGIDNASYQKTDEENMPNRKYKEHNKERMTNPMFGLKTWHKFLLLAVIVIVVACVCAIVVVIYTNKHNFSDSHGSTDCHEQAQVVGSSENTCQIILSSSACVTMTNLALIYLLWTFIRSLVALLTKRDGERSRDEKYETKTDTYSKKEKVDDLLIAPDHLRIVSRTDWLAQPVVETIDTIIQPVPWVIITHTATEGCFMQSQCVLRVRSMQTFHIESKGWSDIGYNFMVGGDGSAYVGRGWDKVGAHTKGYNKYAISIAFIGTFNTETPSKHQVDACKKLIRLGVAKGKLAQDYKLLAHRQLMSTLSPGDEVFKIIKTWSHFYNETDISAIIPKY